MAMSGVWCRSSCGFIVASKSWHISSPMVDICPMAHSHMVGGYLELMHRMVEVVVDGMGEGNSEWWRLWLVVGGWITESQSRPRPMRQAQKR